MAWGKQWACVSVAPRALQGPAGVEQGYLGHWLMPICFTHSSSPDLRFSMALCDQEKAFRQQRKENIKENMKKLLGPKKSEGLYSTRDVSWKFFKCDCNLIRILFVLSPKFHPNMEILRLSIISFFFLR